MCCGRYEKLEPLTKHLTSLPSQHTPSSNDSWWDSSDFHPLVYASMLLGKLILSLLEIKMSSLFFQTKSVKFFYGFWCQPHDKVTECGSN